MTEATLEATTATNPEAAGENNRSSWLFLILAGVVEVGYAISVGGSEGFTNLSWSVSALIFFLFTLFFLSIALRKIDVGIGYAVWVGIGAVGAVIASAFFFDEPVTFTRVFWLSIIIGGVVWLKVADSPALGKKGRSGTEATREIQPQ